MYSINSINKSISIKVWQKKQPHTHFSDDSPKKMTNGESENAILAELLCDALGRLPMILPQLHAARDGMPAALGT